MLYNRFHNSDPINKKDANSLNIFLDDCLVELKAQSENITITSMVGASGSFEVVESINGTSPRPNQISIVGIEDYREVSQKIISSSTTEREEMKGLPSSRVKLIVVAMILIDKAIKIISPESIKVSPYALKEGLLSELD